jgi:predicted unusual protein kinase regulating ubiquinone biosynthesis (AarF/ABC1/UbiB family)
MGLVKNTEKRSTFGRGFQLGRLGLNVVGSYLGYQAQNFLLGEGQRTERKVHFQMQASRWVRDELGVLKGPMMKLGQALSMQSKTLPKHVVQELANLQMRAPGMHATLTRAQFKGSLGKYPEEMFREFDPEPFAAASLGQVHRAVTRNGEKAAVKIQYPAIRSAIENDFKLVRSATWLGRMSGHVPKGLMDEFQKCILEETDYVGEADNLEFFRKELSKLTYLSIPKVHRELSTDRVLTMSYIEGEILGDFLKGKPSANVRDLIGGRLIEMQATQAHWLKAVHADHHPGNYLFRPNGDIGLVDFGSVKRLHIEISELNQGYLERTWQKGEKEARHFLKLLFGPKVPYKRARRVLPLLEQLCDVFYPRDPAANAVVDFSDPKLHQLESRCQQMVLREKLIDPECALLGRAQMGLDHILYELGARVNAMETWRRVLGAKAAGDYR